MPLTQGTRLGPYEVIGSLGAGGMGEVYRAHDTALNRDVAIKVLPASLAGDPDRLARFQREAEALAALNHPNIAQVYGVVPPAGFEEVRPPDQGDGAASSASDPRPLRAIVMELVEGPTLAERIRAGPLPLDEALPMARQIAEALEAAHERGIIHRDLKPANVKVKDDGIVKVLDFGLAKAIEPAPASAAAEELANSPTLTARATEMGVVLGTAAYMAPEQAKGKPVDKRVDVWAFGVVLFEMLTGKRPFDGSDVSEVMASVIKSDPDWSALPATTPRAVERLLHRCLVKPRNDRLHDIGDARLEIDDAASESAGVSGDSPGATRPAVWWLAMSAAAAIVLTSLAAWTMWPGSEPRAVTSFDHLLPFGHRPTGAQVLALSRDGRQFVYITEAGLFRRTMDNREARLIPGTEAGLTNPAFSPDGQSVGYFQDGQLKRIPVAGAAPVVIAEEGGVQFGVSWETDGTILYGHPEGIKRVSEKGGTAEVVIPARDGELVYGPQLLPDGDSVLFTVNPGPGFGRWSEARIVVESIRTGVRTDLDITGSNARYVSTGHLVYALEDALYAVAFDVDRLAVVGGAASMVQDVARTVLNTTGAAQYAMSDEGTLVYLTGTPDSTTRTLVWVDREGRETPVGAPPRAYENPRLSPDETRVMYSLAGPGAGSRRADIWTWDLARQIPARITFNAAANRSAVWIDDARVAFTSNRDGSNRLYVESVDGGGDAEPLEGTEGEAEQPRFATAVTPDGSRLIMETAQAGSGRGRDLAVVSLEGGGMIGEPLGTDSHEIQAAVSPDGNWIAFASDRSGLWETYVAPFPDVGGGVPVSFGGGVRPVWHPNGGELFYWTYPGSRLMSVPVVTSPSFDFWPAVGLFDASPYNIQGGRHYDIARDGRFLMVKRGEERPAIASVLNWVEELKRLVPVR